MFPLNNLGIIYDIDLNPGECLYLPAFWWHQFKPFTYNEDGEVISFQYEVASIWSKMLYRGILDHLI